MPNRRETYRWQSARAISPLALSTEFLEKSMTNGPAASEIQRLLDKQAITEVLYRYSRGVDRCDRSTLATVYWPDAQDDHMIFQGSGDALLDYLSTAVLHMRTQHRLANILIQFDGA